MYGCKKSGKEIAHMNEFKQLYLFLAKHLCVGEKILIGLSGGPDSTLLFHIVYGFFYKNNLSLDDLLVVHMNHKSRKESDHEEEAISQYCKNLGVTCIQASFFGKKKNETMFRYARKSFFEHTIKHIGDNVIFLSGHHLDDRIETYLLHIKRGAGLRGKINMTKKKQAICRPLGTYIQYVYLRPLLSYSKQEVLNFCSLLGVGYFTDSSNFDPTITQRNLIRCELQGLTTDDYDTYTRLFEGLEKEYNESRQTVQYIPCKSIWKDIVEYYKLLVSSDITISTLQDILDVMGIYTNITTSFLIQIQGFVHSGSGYMYIRGWYIRKCHNILYLIKSTRKFRGDKVLLPYPHQYDGICRGHFPGDRFRGKRFRAFLISQKIPYFLRNHIPIIEVDGKIVSTLYHSDLTEAGYM